MKARIIHLDKTSFPELPAAIFEINGDLYVDIMSAMLFNKDDIDKPFSKDEFEFSYHLKNRDEPVYLYDKYILVPLDVACSIACWIINKPPVWIQHITKLYNKAVNSDSMFGIHFGTNLLVEVVYGIAFNSVKSLDEILSLDLATVDVIEINSPPMTYRYNLYVMKRTVRSFFQKIKNEITWYFSDYRHG